MIAVSHRYPLVLSSLGLILGAATGAALRSTAVEDRSIGPASDAVKGQARQQVAGHLKRVLAAADQVMSSVESRLGDRAETSRRAHGEATGPEAPQSGVPHEEAKPSDEVDKTAVVVERAEDAVVAQASITGKPA